MNNWAWRNGQRYGTILYDLSGAEWWIFYRSPVQHHQTPDVRAAKLDLLRICVLHAA